MPQSAVLFLLYHFSPLQTLSVKVFLSDVMFVPKGSGLKARGGDIGIGLN